MVEEEMATITTFMTMISSMKDRTSVATLYSSIETSVQPNWLLLGFSRNCVFYFIFVTPKYQLSLSLFEFCGLEDWVFILIHSLNFQYPYDIG